MNRIDEILSRVADAHCALATALDDLRTETAHAPNAERCVLLAQNEAESSLHWVNAAVERMRSKS